MHPELSAFLKREQKRDKAIGDAWLFPSHAASGAVSRSRVTVCASCGSN
jgi:hypothetical protein